MSQTFVVTAFAASLPLLCLGTASAQCYTTSGQLGRVTVAASSIPVPGPLPNTTADVLQIDCDDVPSIGVTIQVTEPPPGVPYRGTVVICSGGRGLTFFSSETFGLPLFQQLLPLGFRLVDRAWLPGWFTHKVSVRRQSCRFATLLQYIKTNYHTGGPFLAMGSSGGAAEIAYTMVAWDGESTLDGVVLGGGPPMARLDYQCPDPPSPRWLEMCQALIPPNVITCGIVGCTRIQRGFGLCDACEPTPTTMELAEDSLLHTGADLDYPNTRVHILNGSEDCFDTLPSSMLYYNAITSEKVREFVPGAPHFVVQTQDGIDAIKRALLAEATCQPGTMEYREWPHLGGALALDVHGRPGDNFYVFSSASSAILPIGPLGWLFLGAPVFQGGGQLDANGDGALIQPIPVLPALLGFEAYYQALIGTCLGNVVRFEFLPEVTP
ncbi:MAG: hypothetical protein AAF628_07320 [Planctomycetota bacterium]